MKLPIAWLRDYLDIEPDAEAIAARLAAMGFPVEEIARRPALSGIVAGRVARIVPHPDADRLVVCTLDVGCGRELTIATAATNVVEGMTVPVATIGARVVGMDIGARTMRGVASEGMLCSAEELGIPPEGFVDGILGLDASTLPGTDVVAALRLGDAVLDVEVTTNRPDCLSVVGLAREIAASLASERLAGDAGASPGELGAAPVPAVREPTLAEGPYDPSLSAEGLVRLESPGAVRFVAQRVASVPTGEAPFWMRLRLALAGQRPIDALVDVTNFVMLETGQPLHVYDAAALAPGGLVVRDAAPGETLRTLDGAPRELDPRMLVVADAAEAQCVAGVMGGAASAVGAATREVVLEAATFSGPRVRRASIALGLRSEASSRHEKGLPPGLADRGAARAAALLAELGATLGAPSATAGPGAAPAAGPLHVPVARFAALLGTAVSGGEAVAALRALGFAATLAAGGESVEAVAPFWRGDVRIAEDLVEEVARVIGYDRIAAVLPPVLPQRVDSGTYRRESAVAHALAGLGYRETVSLALEPGSVAERWRAAGVAAPQAIEIDNPLSEEQRYLRFSLAPALLAHAARFASDAPARTFELGRVFERAEGGAAVERAQAAWLLVLPPLDEPAWRDSGFLAFAGDAAAFVRELCGAEPETVAETAAPGLHPGKAARLVLGGATVATLGAVDPRIAGAYGIAGRAYLATLDPAALPARATPRYAAPSRYPAVARDLALVVAAETPAAALAAAVRAGGDASLQSVAIVDEYRGPQVPEGRKSVAVRLVFQRRDGTLTDAEVADRVAAIVAAVRGSAGATVRTEREPAVNGATSAGAAPA